MTNVCGTGSWTGPLPGDPDVNNSVLSANAAFGGINVSWIYPAMNPHAVAHTLLYRAQSNDFSLAIQRVVVTGNSFYDQVDADQQYFYWIKIVSVNGTVGTLIGPASATAKPLIADMITRLSGQINSGLLAQSLSNEIDKITLNYAELQAEILSRLNSENVLSLAMAGLQGDMTQALAFVSQEITTRASGDTALAQQINTIAATNGNSAAAILAEQTARISADSALATSVSSVLAATNNNAAAITTEITARTNADSALAGQITTTQTTLNGNIASAQSTLQTNINTVDGKVTAIGALYTVKVNVNGVVGGYGIYNNGSTVQAGFDVNTFWVGRTTADSAVKPFIVENDTVYINQAAINKLTFSKLTDEAGTFVVANGKVKAEYLKVTSASIDGVIQSTNFDGVVDSAGQIMNNGTAGWAMDKQGYAVFNNIKVRGDIQATSINGVAVNTTNVANSAITQCYMVTATAVAQNSVSVEINIPANCAAITVSTTGGIETRVKVVGQGIDAYDEAKTFNTNLFANGTLLTQNGFLLIDPPPYGTFVMTATRETITPDYRPGGWTALLKLLITVHKR